MIYSFNVDIYKVEKESYSIYFLTKILALWPPKPKELDKAYCTSLLVLNPVSRRLVDKPLLQLLDTGDKFNGASRPQQMSHHGFGGINFQPVGLPAEQQLNRPRFKKIIVVGTGAVGIDIGNVLF